MRSAIAYRPVNGLVTHSLVHSVLILSRSCWWSFAIVVSSAGSKSVASLLSRQPCHSLLCPCALGPTIGDQAS